MSCVVCLWKLSDEPDLLTLAHLVYYVTIQARDGEVYCVRICILSTSCIAFAYNFRDTLTVIEL